MMLEGKAVSNIQTSVIHILRIQQRPGGVKEYSKIYLKSTCMTEDDSAKPKAKPCSITTCMSYI